jgi:two-component system CheB/CheR fusion protein
MSSRVSDFLRQHKDAILHSWETRVASETREVELTGLALRDDIPELLDDLDAWLASGAAPESSLLATRALRHVIQRLDAGLPLGQVFREYRLLRETIIEKVLGAEAAEQQRAGAAGDGARIARIVELARLNAGLDVVLSQTVEQFVDERDRRAAAERARADQVVRESQSRYRDALRAREAETAFQLALSDALRPLSDPSEIHATVTRTARDHFEADRCYYCEIEGDTSVIRRDASREDLPSVVGEYPLDSFPIFRAIIDAGRPVVVADASTTDLLDEELRRRCVQMQILSFLDVPVIKEGKPAGILCITQCAPRSWADHEVRLAVDTAERTWAAVDRARAEVALREANARLLEADRRKNEFLAILSHELRNPLAPIRNSIYILEHAAPGGEQAQRARQVIDRQAQHMARLIDDLLDVTRVSRGKIALQRERVDLAAIARGTAEDHRASFARSGIDLEVEDAGRPLWVEGDRTRLAQVIGNLLANSAKFTPRGGQTVLAVEERANQAVVRVRDTGAGMSAETLEHVFEPFVQGAQTIERTGGGLGLGLALVKELVELHGGRVTARSEGEGRGSEFVVSLQLHAPVAAAVDAGSGSLLQPKARRVLVVEDNGDSAETLRDALALSGHEVTVAHAGLEGLASARAFCPDVVLCDIGLPGMDGYEFARAIRRDSDPKLRGVFLVALSGYALPADVERSRAAGFDRHVPKPPRIEALVSLLAEASAGPDESAP